MNNLAAIGQLRRRRSFISVRAVHKHAVLVVSLSKSHCVLNFPPAMASWMGYFTGRRDAKASARDAIVTLRQQLAMLEKKEDYLQKKIDEEVRKARANAVSNKAGER